MPRESLRTFYLGVICVTMVLAGMGFAAMLFGPMVAALVLGIVCAPLTDKVEDVGVPRVVAAALVLALFLAFAITLFLLVEPTVSRAIANSSRIWTELTDVTEFAKSALSGVREFQATVSEALNETEAGAAPVTEAAPSEEQVEVPGAMEALAYAPSLLAGLMIFVGTLYFFLVARTDIYDRVERMQLKLSKQVLCAAEARVSEYFLTISLINAGFGSLVGITMAALGMPNAVLWGLGAFLLNFILYLGPICFAAALVVGGLIAFDGPYSYLPAALYLGMNLMEGQFVTPSLVGRHMHVNPLLVFVSLVFWLWLWGPIGGVVAIPMLVWLLYVVEKLQAPEPRVALVEDAAEAARLTG